MTLLGKLRKVLTPQSPTGATDLSSATVPSPETGGHHRLARKPGEFDESAISEMSDNERTLVDVLRASPFSSHNVRLTPRVTTIPNSNYLEMREEDSRVKCVLHILQSTFGESLSGLRIADLGCLEGGYSIVLGLAGAEVVGVEARDINVAKCNFLKDHFALNNVTFVRDDVKNFTADKYGQFDAILAFGILYHLSEPVEWLQQLGAMNRRLLLLDTHVAPDTDAGLELINANTTFDKNSNPLSAQLDTVSVHGAEFCGRWFHEYAEATPDDLREQLVWSAYSNSRSFWLTRFSLYHALEHASYTGYGERFDFHTSTADGSLRFTQNSSRVFLTAWRG
jgi:SAM-dependent methyltransferase